jgi:hypothetical protein
MKKVLISILSDHIIPNYLYAKEMEGKYDEYIFITTKHSEERKKGIHFENALNVNPNSIRRILLSHENFAEISEKLKSETFDKQKEYCINQTGGTKVMSIALFMFFQNYNARFVYIPIGENEYYDFGNKISHPIKYRLSLKEYLSLYGLTYECDNSLIFDEDYTNKVFSDIQKKEFLLTSIPQIVGAQQLPTKEEKRYWGGTWFEEYTFNRVRREFFLPEESISLSVKIYRDNSLVNDNEIDVAFVKDNVLNIIECKVNKSTSKKIGGYLYKIAAISKDLGLYVNSYLFILHNMNAYDEKTIQNIDKRCRILGVKGFYSNKELSEKTLNL